eukprot:12778084-Ditylum_brightwellii.AAC.1
MELNAGYRTADFLFVLGQVVEKGEGRESEAVCGEEISETAGARPRYRGAKGNQGSTRQSAVGRWGMAVQD